MSTNHANNRPLVNVCFVTLGCAKNEVDTRHMKQRLMSAGYSICEDTSLADVLIVNTCTFISEATEESIDTIFGIIGPDKTGFDGDFHGKLVIAGCMPSRYGIDLHNEFAEADAFLPCADEENVVSVIDELMGIQEKEPVGLSIVDEAIPVSAYVKISDGCNRFCSFCVIPYIRGRYHSFTFEQIDSEVLQLIGRGVKEIVLIAQDTGIWGSDFKEKDSLANLLSRLASEYPQTWFRVMYTEPEGVTEKLLDVMLENQNICRYLDIPIQHVSPIVLKAMRRSGSSEKFDDMVKHIRSRIPDITLRTTLIVGFPGESEEEFDGLCDFVADGLFDYIGVFPYSREEGTLAYDLPDQIDEDTKIERARVIRDIADNVSSAKIAANIDKVLDVLVEGTEEDGQIYGRCMCQAPEVDGVTYLASGNIGDVLKVRITDTVMYEMEGDVL